MNLTVNHGRCPTCSQWWIRLARCSRCACELVYHELDKRAKRKPCTHCDCPDAVEETP